MTDERQSIAESNALMAAISAIEGSREKDEVIATVRNYREAFCHVPTIEGVLIRTALWVICGRPEGFVLPAKMVKDRSLEGEVFLALANGWLGWALLDKSPSVLRRLIAVDVDSDEGSTLHKMALSEWKLAIQALIEKNTEESQRRFRRAMKIGAEYGTPSNPIVHWTFAASFFHAK